MYKSYQSLLYLFNDIDSLLTQNCKLKRCSECKYYGYPYCFSFVLYDAIVTTELFKEFESLKLDFELFEKERKNESSKM